MMTMRTEKLRQVENFLVTLAGIAAETSVTAAPPRLLLGLPAVSRPLQRARRLLALCSDAPVYPFLQKDVSLLVTSTELLAGAMPQFAIAGSEKENAEHRPDEGESLRTLHSKRTDDTSPPRGMFR